MTNKDVITQMTTAILAAQTLGELYALMEDYSYREFMEVYNQLTAKQQTALDKIRDRDITIQLAILNTVTTVGERGSSKQKRFSQAQIVN